MTPRTTPTPRPHRLAFSLIELLVIIAIIVIVLGLAVAGISMAYQRTEESSARAILGALAGVEKEYRAQTGQSIPASANGNVGRANGFLSIVQDNSTVAGDMLRNIQRQYRTMSGNTVSAVNDPWGNPIFYNDGTGGSTDMTTPASNRMPKSNYPFFASRGADGAWGTFTNDDPAQPATLTARDNLFSFEVK
jgi:type II secretory pathway pseudopilin PulG